MLIREAKQILKENGYKILNEWKISDDFNELDANDKKELTKLMNNAYNYAKSNNEAIKSKITSGLEFIKTKMENPKGLKKIDAMIAKLGGTDAETRPASKKEDKKLMEWPSDIEGQVKAIMSGEFTAEELYSNMVKNRVPYAIRLLKSRDAHEYSELYWKRDFVSISHMKGGGGGEINDRGAEHFKKEMPKWIQKFIDECNETGAFSGKYKSKVMDDKKATMFLVDMDTATVLRSKEDIHSAYDLARFIEKGMTRDLTFEEVVELYKKWFNGYTFKGTLHDYEWGEGPIEIKFTDRDYYYYFGGFDGGSGEVEDLHASWNKIVNDDQTREDFEDFANPTYYIRELVRQGEKFDKKLIHLEVST